ncbi:MAG: methionine synthase [Myxococcota bacterium]|nr:methionine synthase [Myxococcota bacterium]
MIRTISERLRMFLGALQNRILVLDGAMGTMIQALGLSDDAFRGTRFAQHPYSVAGNNDLLCLTRPDDIERIHRAYLEAGADIIECNSFNATAISQAEFGTQEWVFELNLEAARIARRAADAFQTPQRPRFVAGAIGPTSHTLSLSRQVDDPAAREVDFVQMQQAYAEQIRGLVQGGVDLLLIETIFDTLNAKAAIAAALEVGGELGIALPLMLSLTVSDASRRCLSGQSMAAFAISVAHARPVAIGLNCGLGAEQMGPLLEELRQHVDCALLSYPNAGLPNAFGGYDQSPDEMASIIAAYVRAGRSNIVGGCCGTTPAFIAAIAKAVEGIEPPDDAPARIDMPRFAGLDPSVLHPELGLFMIGERSNVMGSRRFARLIREGRYEEACSVVREQVEAGANAIDVCMDDDQLEASVAMQTFLRWVAADASIARLPVVVDSSRFEVIEQGLHELQGKPIVNSLSLKDGEQRFIERARRIRQLGAAVIVMAADEQGQACERSRRVAILSRAHAILRQLGFDESEIIFDPNVLAIGTGIAEHEHYAVDFIETCAELRATFPRSPISGGVSNLSFAFRGQEHIREALHSVFLHHAMAAGMNMAIVNPAQLAVLDTIEPELRSAVEALVLNRRRHPDDDPTERVLAFTRQQQAAATTTTAVDAREGQSLEERLRSALLLGRVEHLEADLREASQVYPSAFAIVEGPLMQGMNEVGKRFGSGEMFLPQVVKTARVMKRAVDFLRPMMSDGELDSLPRMGKILLATVKGDVHDIGKSIVAVVLGCNGYEVIDLGVQVPNDVIVRAAKEQQVDAIGVSGLISPSLDEMVLLARMLEEAGLNVPLLIGGATTSARHTALRIAPKYSGPCVHVPDASQAPARLGAFLSDQRRQLAFAELRRQQASLVAQHERLALRPLHSLEEARRQALQSDWELLASELVPTGEGVFSFTLSELEPFISWQQLLEEWSVGKEQARAVAEQLIAEARALLAALAGQRICRAAFRLYPAASDGDDLLFFEPDGGSFRLPMLRQQRIAEPSKANLCWADFVAPRHHPWRTAVGLFAATVPALGDEAGEQGLLFQSLAHVLVEAAAAKLEEQVAQCFGRPVHRPAIGYPSIPDHSLKQELFEHLDPERQLGVELTEQFMMQPAASVCGLLFSHPSARYFSVGRLDDEQLEDYAKRRGQSLASLRRHLAL